MADLADGPQRQGEQQGDVDQGGPDAAGSGGRPLGERQRLCRQADLPGHPVAFLHRPVVQLGEVPDPGPTLDVLPARHHRGGIVGPLDRPPSHQPGRGPTIPTTLAAGLLMDAPQLGQRIGRLRLPGGDLLDLTRIRTPSGAYRASRLVFSSGHVRIEEGIVREAWMGGGPGWSAHAPGPSPRKVANPVPICPA